MKEYIQLSIDAMAYHSGNTYYEEVFLPKHVWEEIKEEFQMHTYLCGFDGKHSEVKVDIEVDEWNDSQLTGYQANATNDGDDLFNHIYEYLDAEKYDEHYLLKVQEEVKSYCQVETLMIKINKNKKEEVLSLLKDYLM